MQPSSHSATAWVGVLVLLAVITTAHSQQSPPVTDESAGQDVTVVLEGRQRARFRLAFPEFGGADRLPPELARAAQELEKTLRSDLEASRVVVLQGPQEVGVLNLTGDMARDFELYRSLQNELVLLGQLKSEAGKLVLEGRLHHLESGDAILGKRYRGNPAVARRIAHTFADEIILTLSGRQGVALTHIAFYSDRSGHKEIYLMDYDGANQRPITAHKSISMTPDWSPTGKSVAYVSYFSGTPGVYLADLATGRKRPVINEGTLNVSPSFAPDGRRLTLARSEGGGNTEIYVANRNGSGLQRLTHSSGIDTNPSWSPSGREIAFTSSRAGTPHIYLMDAEGANLRRLSFEGDYNDGASWSPDGTRVVYASRRSGRFNIAVTDVVTLETKLLTSSPGSQETPSFAPDGHKIAFASQRGGRTQIYVMDADGSNAHPLTRDGNNLSPAWSRFTP